MKDKRNDFFWPSYVDLMTTLFAVVLVLFVLTFLNFKRELAIKAKEADLLNKVKSNLKMFDNQPDVFYYNRKFNRIQLAFNIKFHAGYQYYHISSTDIDGNFPATQMKLNLLGTRIKTIIDTFKRQKAKDSTMKDISYLMVISGSASRLHGDDEYKSSVLSYNRALFLYKYLKESLGIDFDSDSYHNIIELQISGMGFGGVGRKNYPYVEANINEEFKNQRFIISIAPKIGIGN